MKIRKITGENPKGQNINIIYNMKRTHDEKNVFTVQNFSRSPDFIGQIYQRFALFTPKATAKVA